MIILKMKNYNMLTEKQQKQQYYQQYEYLVGEEMPPSDQRRVIKQANFTYSPLGKALENKQKQLKIKEKNK